VTSSHRFTGAKIIHLIAWGQPQGRMPPTNTSGSGNGG